MDFEYIIKCEDLKEALSLVDTFNLLGYRWGSGESHEQVLRRIKYPYYLFLTKNKTLMMNEDIPKVFSEVPLMYPEDFLTKFGTSEKEVDPHIKKKLLIQI